MPAPRPAGAHTLTLADGATISLTSDGKGQNDLESDGLKYEEDGDESTAVYNAAIDGIESLVLAQWAAGVDVTSAAYKEALDTAYEAISNNLG
jgi:xanthine/CO dehydrogenase XdhC/CoxF family maturation factor